MLALYFQQSIALFDFVDTLALTNTGKKMFSTTTYTKKCPWLFQHNFRGVSGVPLPVVSEGGTVLKHSCFPGHTAEWSKL